MPSLPEVKIRIRSTENTRKITQAMQFVAANKMKGFQKKALSSRSYAWSLLDGFAQSRESFRHTIYGENRTKGKKLFVLVTADKGLAGSLNTRLIEALLKSESWNSLQSEERMLITIGKKSAEAARRRKIPIVRSFQGLQEKMNALESLHIISSILGYWESGEAREVMLISPHYVNPFLIHITEKRYLPFNEEMLKSHFEWHPEKSSKVGGGLPPLRNLFFEPTEEDVVEVLALQLVQTLFLQAFFELKASEYSSRMVAMKHATEAADEVIEKLTLDYNKVRQSMITQQLSELAAGRQALGVNN